MRGKGEGYRISSDEIPILLPNKIPAVFFFSSRRRHTRYWRDWSSDVCSSDLWVYLVNIPVGAAGVVLSYSLLPEIRGTSASGRPDLLGAATVTTGLVLLVFGLTRAEEVGFGSPVALGTLLLATVFVGSFVIVERRVADPLVPLGIFRLREFVGAGLVASALTAATVPVGVLATLYLQGVLDYSPSFAGLAGLPFSLSVVA